MTNTLPRPIVTSAVIVSCVAILLAALPYVLATPTYIFACRLDSTGDMRWVAATSSCNGMLETAMQWQEAPEPGSETPLVCGDCNLQGSTFLAGKDLTNAWLFSSNLAYSNFQGTNFNGANIGSSAVSFSDFENANFTNANLTGVTDMSNSTTTGAIWNNTICPDETNSDNNSNTCEGHF